jgi:hypothetical protein
MLARILRLTKGREYLDALAAIEIAFRDQLGTDIDTILTVPNERLLDFMTFGVQSEQALVKTGFAVALLQAAGRVNVEFGKKEQSVPYFEKALGLLLEIELSEEEPPELPEFVTMAEEIIADVALNALSMDTRGALVFYFEREGEFATAEKVLKTMLVDRPDDAEIHELAVSFYEYLLDEDDEQLTEGGLPREQATTALEALKSPQEKS